MLAKPWTGWPSKAQLVAERKFDGHRLLVRVAPSGVTAWSRTGHDRKLSPALYDALSNLPPGVYDGELIVPGGKAPDVARLENRARLHYVVFDVLELLNVPTCADKWSQRRAYLEEIAKRGLFAAPLQLAEMWAVSDEEYLRWLAERVWADGGEGLVVKLTHAPYAPGKRTDAFLKIKQCQSAVLTIVGWEPGTTGDTCVAVLRDDEGVTARVKVLNDTLRAQVARNPRAFIGRKLAIEYHERTADRAYRHPRWDHLL
jgi:bifunctional non-homologous end joining protein LigD